MHILGALKQKATIHPKEGTGSSVHSQDTARLQHLGAAPGKGPLLQPASGAYGIDLIWKSVVEVTLLSCTSMLSASVLHVTKGT